MSGLLALLDDVAAIAKLAASQVDDISAQAVTASSKAAGVVIDDAAVTPKYVTGLPAARELPIIAKIAGGSLFNKLVILMPLLLLLQAFAPWLIPILLIIGGAYLCFEGAEKIWHSLKGHDDPGPQQAVTLDAAHLEASRVKGAIKTDFILSAEIMTIAMASIEGGNIWTNLGVLTVVAIVITVFVYGAVAILVKLDDLGLRLSQSASSTAMRSFGRGLATSMPKFLGLLSVVGTAAMLWVGGSIVIHGIGEVGWHWPYETIKSLGYRASNGGANGVIQWVVVAACDAAFGLALGLGIMPIIEGTLAKISRLFPEKTAEA